MLQSTTILIAGTQVTCWSGKGSKSVMPYLGGWSSTSQLVWCSSHLLAAVWPCLTCNYLILFIIHAWWGFGRPSIHLEHAALPYQHRIIAAERWQFSRGPLQWTPWVRRIAPEALCQEFQCGPVGISPFSKDQTPTSVVECGKNPLKRDLYCQDCPVWQHVGDKWEKELRLGWVIYGVETGRSPKNVSFTPWFFLRGTQRWLSPMDDHANLISAAHCSSDCRCVCL